MEIKYLRLLRDNPVGYPNSQIPRPIIPLSISEIEELENLYSSGNSFPQVLREMLYLAGKSCYVLDYGYDGSIEKMQQTVRRFMSQYNRVLTRPFLVLDVYNVLDQFLFVFLDEGDDPVVYQAHYDPDHMEPGQWYKAMLPSLSTFINRVVQRVKEGGSAF